MDEHGETCNTSVFIGISLQDFHFHLGFDVRSVHTVIYVLQLLLHYFPVQSLSTLLHKCVVPIGIGVPLERAKDHQ